MRSRVFSIVLVAMIPGTAQANDDIRGKKDLPLKPIEVISLSTTNAALCHVTAIFKHSDEKKQDDDLWQENQNSPNPGNDSIVDQATHRSGCNHLFQQALEELPARFRSNPSAKQPRV